MFFLGIYFLYSIVLTIVVWLFARHEADFTFGRLMLITVAFDVVHALLHAATLIYLPVSPLVSMIIMFVIAAIFLAVLIYRYLYVPLSGSIFSSLITSALWIVIVMAVNGKELKYYLETGLESSDYCWLIRAPKFRDAIGLNPAARVYCASMKSGIRNNLLLIATYNQEDPEEQARQLVRRMGENLRNLLSPSESQKFERLFLALHLDEYKVVLPPPLPTGRRGVDYTRLDDIDIDVVLAEIKSRDAALEMLESGSPGVVYWALRWLLDDAKKGNLKPAPAPVLDKLAEFILEGLARPEFLLLDGGEGVTLLAVEFLKLHGHAQVPALNTALAQAKALNPQFSTFAARRAALAAFAPVTRKKKAQTNAQLLRQLKDWKADLMSPKRGDTQGLTEIRYLYANHGDVLPEVESELAPVILNSPHARVRKEVLEYVLPSIRPEKPGLLIQVANFEQDFPEARGVALAALLRLAPGQARVQAVGRMEDARFVRQVVGIWSTSELTTESFLTPLLISSQEDAFNLAMAVLAAKKDVTSDQLQRAVKLVSQPDRSKKLEALLAGKQLRHFSSVRARSFGGSPSYKTADALVGLYGTDPSSTDFVEVVRSGRQAGFPFDGAYAGMRWADSPDPNVRGRALTVVAVLGDKKYLDRFKQTLASPNPANGLENAAAVFGLLRFDPAAGRESFVTFSAGDGFHDAVCSEEGPFVLGSGLVNEKEIILLLQNRDPRVLGLTLKVLGRTGGAQSLEVLPKIPAYHAGNLDKTQLGALVDGVNLATSQIRKRAAVPKTP